MLSFTAVAVVTLASCAVSLAADHIYQGPFREPYALPRPHRQVPRQAPFPLSSGSPTRLSSGSLPLPSPLFSSLTPTKNIAPSAVGPASALAIPTASLITGRPILSALAKNSSSIPEYLVSNSSLATIQYAPAGTAPLVRQSGRPRTSPNGTCSGATLNVLDASLDWWYSKTYTQVESTFLVQFGDNATATGWTLLPAETTFDVTSAIADPTCTSTTAFNTLANETQLHYSCWNTPTPIAAATTTVEQTAFRSINATSSTGSVPDIVTTPTPAALTIGKSNETVAAGTPVVYFSKYEIVNKLPSRRHDGHVKCVERTTTHRLNKTHTFEYRGKNLDTPAATDDGVVGKLQFAFLQAVGQATATPGTWVAEPTVVVVLKKIAAAQAVLGMGVETPESLLQTITPTLPSGLSTLRTTPTDAGTFWMPLTPSIESSATALDVPTRTQAATTAVPAYVAPADDDGLVGVPFVAHVEHSDVILEISVNPTKPHAVVTALWNGQTVTATALANNISPSGNNVGQLLSAIAGAASPANALEVLNQAQQTAGHVDHISFGNLPASAIAAVVGAVHGGSNGGQSNTGNQLSDEQSGAFSQGGSYTSNGGSGVGSQSGGKGNGQGSGISDHVDDDDRNGGNGVGQSLSSQDGKTDQESTGRDSSGGRTHAAQGSDISTNGNSKPVLNIGGSMVTGTIVGGRTAPAIIIGGQTAVAGGQAITVSGTRVAVLPGAAAIIVDGSTMHIAATTANSGDLANIPLVTIGKDVFTANAATQFNIGGSTLTPGGQIVVSRTTISLAADASQVAVNGQMGDLSPPVITPAPLLTLDGTVYKANQGSTYNVGGHFLVPGGAVAVSGTTISLSPDGTHVFVDGSAQPSIARGTDLETITAPPMLTVDGQAYSPNGGTSYIISGQTLMPGGAITFNGPAGLETISLNNNANELFNIANGVTGTSAIGLLGAAASGSPILTIDGKTYMAVEYSPGLGAMYLVSGQKLTPGGSIVLTDGDRTSTISLMPAGTALVTISNGTTSISRIAGAYAVMPTNAPILTIGGETFTAINNGATYNIHGDVLTPGGTDTVIIDSQTYIVTLSPHATVLEIQRVGPDVSTTSTSFETLFPATMTGSTVSNTAIADGAAATARSSGSNGSASSGSLANRASSSMAVEVTAVMVMTSSLILAFWL